MPEYTKAEIQRAWSEESIDLESTLIFDNPESILAQGFTQIPNSVLRDSALSTGARLTYAVLLSYAWKDEQCFPGQERIAQDLGVTAVSIIKYLKELVELEYISSRRRGLGKTNIYTILTRNL